MKKAISTSFSCLGWGTTFLLFGVLPLFLLSCKKDKKTEVTPTPVIDTRMTYIKADNAKFQYTGRINFSNPLAPKFWFPGVSIKAKFTGPFVDVVLKDFASGGTTTTNYFTILIDDVVYKELQVNSSDTIYTISKSLTNTAHTIEIFKRTEASVGACAFLGLRIQINNVLQSLPAPTRRIEFIGDSFTCGYGNEASIAYPGGNPTTGFHSVNENNYKAWGAILGRELGAAYHCTAYSGRGMYRNNSGSTAGVLPSIYSRIEPDNSGSTWNTSNFIPDLVVIHLGTNDFAPEQNASPNMVDSTSFVDSYINFITSLRGYYPSAKIICVVPNSVTDGYPAGFKTLTRMTSYHHAIVNKVNQTDANVFYFALTPQGSPYGEDWHPSATTHQSMANQIRAFIQTKTGW